MLSFNVFVLTTALLGSASAVAGPPTQPAQPFAEVVSAHFLKMLSLYHANVLAVIDRKDRDKLLSVSMRIESMASTCGPSPASTKLGPDGPIVSICTRVFRYFYDFVEGFSYYTVYGTLSHASPQQASEFLKEFWNYVAKNAKGDVIDVTNLKPQKLACTPYVYVYLYVAKKAKPDTIMCVSGGDALDVDARRWLFSTEGAFSGQYAEDLFRVAGKPLDDKEKLMFVRGLHDAYIKWLYLYVIFHEFGHILNGDLAEKSGDIEINADKRALDIALRINSEEVLLELQSFAIAEAYWEPFRENSKWAPFNQNRILLAYVDYFKELKKQMDALPEPLKSEISDRQKAVAEMLNFLTNPSAVNAHSPF